MRMLDLPDFRGLIPGVRLTGLRGHMTNKEVQVKTFILVAILIGLSLLVLPNGRNTPFVVGMAWHRLYFGSFRHFS